MAETKNIDFLRAFNGILLIVCSVFLGILVNKVNDLSNDVKTLLSNDATQKQQITQHDKDIDKLGAALSKAQDDVNGLKQYAYGKLYALKPDEIRVRQSHAADN